MHGIHHQDCEYCQAIEQKLDRILEVLQLLANLQEISMADLSKLQAEVTSISNTDDAVLALIDGLVTQLKNAGSDQAAVDQIVSDLETKRTSLAAAVTANTPTAPPAA